CDIKRRTTVENGVEKVTGNVAGISHGALDHIRARTQRWADRRYEKGAGVAPAPNPVSCPA
ncbi:MAG: hypothetical protein P8M28_09450, partial [Alphaproteobacteria bacterium]|nr:hypothetical protein [Alphaproteobacteria bacterium]